ncbi:hypothetical protein [Mycolicibacterium sarraceniae]|uniref:hypothetical protein n=1 Tax=Mycolicibacterium sarraceniae TaxID=1534348 RepID=UPI0013D0553E|nr:hypothetical protein [Mycolicibacterium sarraceniae]
MSTSVVVDAPVDHFPMRWALGTRLVEGGETVLLGLKMDDGADIAQRAIHIDDHCSSAMTPVTNLRREC